MTTSLFDLLSVLLLLLEPTWEALEPDLLTPPARPLCILRLCNAQRLFCRPLPTSLLGRPLFGSYVAFWAPGGKKSLIFGLTLSFTSFTLLSFTDHNFIAISHSFSLFCVIYIQYIVFTWKRNLTVVGM